MACFQEVVLGRSSIGGLGYTYLVHRNDDENSGMHGWYVLYVLILCVSNGKMKLPMVCKFAMVFFIPLLHYITHWKLWLFSKKAMATQEETSSREVVEGFRGGKLRPQKRTVGKLKTNHGY